MESRFKKPSEDLVLNKLSRWNEFKRKKTETIRMFWIRHGRIYSQLRAMNVDWPDPLRYLKAYQSLDLLPEQRMVITSALEAAQRVGSVDELRRISIKILDVQDSKREGELIETKERSIDSNGYEEGG